MFGESPDFNSIMRASNFAKTDKVRGSLEVDPAQGFASAMKGDARELSPMNLDDQENHDLIIRCLRALVADLCQHFDGGHPG